MVQLLGNTGRVDKDILLNVVVFLAGIYLYRYVKNVSLRIGVAAAVLLCLVVFVPLPERVTWYLFAVVSDFYGSRKCAGSDKKFAMRDSEKTCRCAFKVFI